ncbi:hypothetical protein [Baaleninema sp.]|uniref:hypothetical protein n=1 Tax=Baaleninema sp. TaxID=3101197 RepID=UPI003D056A2E
MYSPKAQKIEIDREYPCPCRRPGRLKPIALTDAFGCDRCQQIFVLDENGTSIEQLSTHYPYKQVWRWTGTQWTRARSGLKETYLPLALGVILVLAIIWLPLALRLPVGANTIPWIILVVLLAILPAFLVWLAYRRDS